EVDAGELTAEVLPQVRELVFAGYVEAPTGTTPPAGRRTRPTWHDLPASVHAAVGELLGSPVVAAESQPGGFSPGTADRVVTAGGRRAFVKVTGTALNDRSAQFHRREAEIVGALSSPAIPALIGVVDLGDWVAIVSEQVDGHPPALPWRDDDI